MARLVSLCLVALLLILEVVIALNSLMDIKKELEYSTFRRRYEICHLPVARGLCRHGVKSWYFNANTKGCEQFYYSLCGGNANRFYTEKECMDYCSDYAFTFTFKAYRNGEFYDVTQTVLRK